MTEAQPQIELRRVDKLTRDPNNARLHSPEQLEQIISSIGRFGFTSPMLVDDVIRAGNGRHEAAEMIYARGGRIYFPPGEANGGKVLPDGTVPVIDITGLPELDRTALALADNRIALNATWSEERLTEQLRALSDADFDIPTFVGFDLAELHDLLGSGEGATDPDVVAAVLAGAKPHLLVSDPPYGVNYDPTWRDGVDLNLGKKLGQNGSGRSLGVVENDDQADWTEAWALFAGDVAYVWHGGLHTSEVEDSLRRAGFEMRAQIIWNKQIQVFSRGDYHWKHEPCWYAVRKGKKGHYVGGRKQTTIWDIQNNNPLGGGGEQKTGHSTQKPVECMRRPIENNSKVGDAVYEPFSGSFTTGIACQITGRRCYAIELNPAYVDLGVLRMQAFAQIEATLEATGQTFAEVAAERLGKVTEPA